MAQTSANDLLSSILFQVQIANAHMEKIEKNNSDGITKESTRGIKSPLQSFSKISNDTVNAIKGLSAIGLKDVVKVSIMPLDKIAIKLNNFTNILANISKEQSEKALANISVFSSIINAINNIKFDKFKKFPEKAVNKYITSIGNFIDKLTETFKGKFDKRERENITEKINALGGIIDTLTKSIKTVSIVGLLSPVLLPLAILGFGVIILYITSFKLLNKFINAIGTTEEVKDVSASAKNIAIMAMLSAGVVLGSVAIGLLLTKPGVIKVALAGFAVIALTMIALKGVMWLMNKMGSTELKEENSKNVLNILALIGAASLIPLAAIGLGALLSMPGVLSMAALGFGAIGVTLLGFWIISKQIERVGKSSSNSLKAAGSILLLAGGAMLLVLASMGIGIAIAKAGGWKILLQGMGATAAIIAEFGVIALAISATSKIITSKGALIGMAAILGLGALSILLTKKVMELGSFFGSDIKGGWARFGSVLGAMAAMVGSVGVLAGAIGALTMNPLVAVAMGVGMATLLGLSATISALTGAMKKVMDVSIVMGTGEDPTKTPISHMVSFMSNTKYLLETTVDLGKKLSFISIMKTITAIKGIVGAMGDYAKLLQNIGGKEGFVKGINGYDSEGNPIYGEDVDIALTSANLSNGFSVFINTVMTTLNGIDWKSYKNSTTAKIWMLLNPVSKFAKIIQEVGAEEGKIRSIQKYDENGNPVYGENIEIVPVSKNISAGFAIFAQNIMDGLQNTSTSMSDFRKANVMGAIMEPVSKFAKIIQEFGAGKGENELVSLTFDENGNITGKEIINAKTIASRIANCFETFMTQMQTTLDKFKTPSFSLNKVDVSDIIEPVIDIIEKMRDKLQGSDVDTFTKNVDTIGQSFSNMQNLYVSPEAKALNKIFPELTKNHVEFINKMNTAMKNIKSPLEKYVEQVERLVNAYDKLSQKYDANGNLVLTLEENTNTNNTVNVDKNALENLADDISSKITDGTKEAINNISITMQNPVKNPNVPNISLEVSTN